ncbi:hypothetical protein V8G54_009430 [Vigna mungo]|uniref:JAB1/MPN/MOV34 metalloenzyme domain-containing protein n=1 Tax=Vigna mungo TaxID=3915 RepID=A0AAQ3NY14_VIGMU
MDYAPSGKDSPPKTKSRAVGVDNPMDYKPSGNDSLPQSPMDYKPSRGSQSPMDCHLNGKGTFGHSASQVFGHSTSLVFSHSASLAFIHSASQVFGHIAFAVSEFSEENGVYEEYHSISLAVSKFSIRVSYFPLFEDSFLVGAYLRSKGLNQICNLLALMTGTTNLRIRLFLLSLHSDAILGLGFRLRIWISGLSLLVSFINGTKMNELKVVHDLGVYLERSFVQLQFVSCLCLISGFMLYAFVAGPCIVILKIIKHCKYHSPSLVIGQLLGLNIGSVLEVTNCFPFPVMESVLRTKWKSMKGVSTSTKDFQAFSYFPLSLRRHWTSHKESWSKKMEELDGA